MGGWERLTRYGDFEPAGAPSSGGEVPTSVGELIALHGSGSFSGCSTWRRPGARCGVRGKRRRGCFGVAGSYALLEPALSTSDAA